MKCDFCSNEAVGSMSRCLGPFYCENCEEYAEKSLDDYYSSLEENEVNFDK